MNLPIDYENSHWTVRKAAREEYVRRQNGCCWYCLKPLDEEPINWVASFFEPMSKSFPWHLFPPNFQKYPIHLHHSHETGESIGAVHMKCNAYLWVEKGE